MLAQKLSTPTKNAIKPGKSAFLVIDMYESLNKSYFSYSATSAYNKTKWLADHFTYSHESVVANICNTILLAKRLGIETFVITYEDRVIDSKILKAAGYPQIISKYELDAFNPKCNLIKNLQNISVKNVIISGYHRDACVYFTADGAVKNDFGVIIANPLTLGKTIKREYSQTTKQFRQIAHFYSTLDKLYEVMHQLSPLKLAK